MAIDQRVAHLKPIMAELLRCTMLVRKDMIGNEARELIDNAYIQAFGGEYPSDERVEGILAEMFPWIWGPKSIMPLLISVNSAFDRDETPNGMQIYNVLTICHRLEKPGLLRKSYETFTNQKRELPEPETWMAAVGI